MEKSYLINGLPLDGGVGRGEGGGSGNPGGLRNAPVKVNPDEIFVQKLI